MTRLTVRDIRASRIPQSIGCNASDTPKLCGYINEAQERLVKAGGESGWWGTWARMVWNVDKNDPYITTPREVARIIDIDMCRKPIRIQNEFFEFLEFGYGLQRQFIGTSGCTINRCCQFCEVYDRGRVITPVDLPAGNKLRVYLTNVQDIKKRLFYSGKDSNGNIIETVDNGIRTNGAFISFDTPFADGVYSINELSGLEKDDTLGAIQLVGVNTSTGVETTLIRLQATERNPAYRRYFLNGLPPQCPDCDSSTTTIQLQGIVKLEYLPVVSDTDFLLIQNIPALKNAMQAVRYGEVDTVQARAMSEQNHRVAIKILNEELVHYTGRENPAVHFAPFGNATLERAGLQMI